MQKKTATKIRPKTFVKNMASLKTPDTDPLSNSIRYYGVRIAHRWAFLALIGSTILYWIFLVTTATNVYFLSESGQKVADAVRTNDTISQIRDTMQTFIIRWSILFVIGTLALLAIKRVRSYEKPQIVDSLLIAIFCLGSVALSNSILNYFLSSYLK